MPTDTLRSSAEISMETNSRKIQDIHEQRAAKLADSLKAARDLNIQEVDEKEVSKGAYVKSARKQLDKILARAEVERVEREAALKQLELGE